MNRTVEDLMTTEVVTGGEQTPFKYLVRLLKEHHVSALPIVDEDGRLVGIVSEADLLLKEEVSETQDHGFLGRSRRRIDAAKGEGLTARDVMTRDVIAIRPNAPPGEAARVMHRHHVKRLPVIDRGGRITGIVSRGDLLKVFLRADDSIREEIVGRVLGGMPWIGPENVHVEVRDGVVRLSGEIEQRSITEILGGLVRGIDGVVGVENHLSYREDDTRDRGGAPGSAPPRAQRP
jgi:CBS domain-containing protein